MFLGNKPLINLGVLKHWEEKWMQKTHVSSTGIGPDQALHTTHRPNATLRDRVALALMLLSALGAFYGFISSIGAVTGASLATQQVEVWRMIGLLMFSGVFVLLGFWPRRYPYLWEFTIANKVALTLVQLILISRASNAVADGSIDAVVSAFIVLAYILSRGYESWRQAR
jgi:hypothetical protein